MEEQKFWTKGKLIFLGIIFAIVLVIIGSVFIRKNYLEYFKDFEIIFLYPYISTHAYAQCDGFVVVGGDDVNPKLYNEENTASKGIDDLIDYVLRDINISNDYMILVSDGNNVPIILIPKTTITAVIMDKPIL